MEKSKLAKSAGIILSFFLLFIMAKSYSAAGNKSSSDEIKSASRYINSEAEFDRVLKKEESKLLLIDLYADWCRPCKILSPILEEIAKEKAEEVSVYKINVEKNRSLAQKFKVRGIPLVVLVRDGKAIHRMIGLRTKEDYVKTINHFLGN